LSEDVVWNGIVEHVTFELGRVHGSLAFLCGKLHPFFFGRKEGGLEFQKKKECTLKNGEVKEKND